MPVTKKAKPKTKIVWDLQRDGLSYSSMTLFNRCPEQFRLQYMLGWTSAGFSEPLEFGSCFHHCLEHWDSDAFDAKQIKDDLPAVKARIRALVTGYERTNWNVSKMTKLTSMDVERMELCFGMAEVVFLKYLHYYHKDKFKWIAREQQFRLEREARVSYKIFGCDFLSIPIVGKIDGVYADKSDNWLFETKTMGQIDETGIALSLHNDMQTMTYAYGSEQLTGKKIKGVKYNVIRRPQIYKRKDESMKDYLARLSEDIDKRPEFYFMRWDIRLDKNDLSNFLTRQLDPMLRRFHLWYSNMKDPNKPWDNPYHYVDPTGLHVKSSRCTLFNAITVGDFSGLYQRDVAHPELAK